MMLNVVGWVVTMVLAGTSQPADSGAHQKLRAVPFTQVKINDAFWAPRIETNRTVTLPHDIEYCESTGRIANFAKAAKRMEGKFQGIFFDDSDVYKVIEGAAYSLAQHPDPQLQAKVDQIIDTIVAAQQPDGYLNSYYTLVEPDKRWSDLPTKHELYCAGHLFEAAVAYYQATGQRKLLDAACKFADYIDSVFGPGKRVGYSGHEEIELALIKLYRVTGQARYRTLAEHFLEVRGQKRNKAEEYMQAHLPIREQSDIVGHAVRAMYLYTAVADVAALTGDTGYITAMDRLWDNVVGKKMYVTGGIGCSAKNEGFTANYELPNDSAYAETCASIGMALWNHRLLMLHAQGRFADTLERVMYNGLLSGVSLDGKKFFYVNPLGSIGKHHREAWFGCACCPTNMVRFLPSVGGYIYAENDDGVWVNLYIANEATIQVAGQPVQIKQETRYPWSGEVKVTVEPATTMEFDLALRIPGWCEKATVGVNGEALQAKPVDGYVHLKRTWRRGDVVALNLPMVIQRIAAHPQVAADAGRLALQRGPMVYCLEDVDHDAKVRTLALPREAQLTAQFEPSLLGGVVVLKGNAIANEAVDWTQTLYQPAGNGRNVPITAVPYYAWDNREAGGMVVWLPEALSLAEMPSQPSSSQKSP